MMGSKGLGRRSLMALTLGAVLMAGCSDQAESPVTAATGAQADTRAGQLAAEKAAAADVARAVSLAMQDAGLRHRVWNDLRLSPVREKKLELGNYLRGESGGILLAKMAEETGKTREAVLTLLGSVRPLEFYLPVPAHRDAWKGDASVIVAAQLVESDAPVGFAVGGRAVALSAAAPPAAPVLVMVPVETDFSAARLSAAGLAGPSLNGLDGGECNPETALMPCGDQPTSTPIIYTPGLYLTKTHFSDLGEAWTKGSPEIEVMVLASPPNSPDAAVTPLTCSGESASGSRRFNQDDHSWTGKALLVTQAQVDQYNLDEDNGLTITAWEDDYEPCQIVTDINYRQLVGAAIFYAAGIGVIVTPNSTSQQYCSDPIGGSMCLAGFIYSAVKLWQISAALIATNDDHVGISARRSTISNPGFTGYSHIVSKNADFTNRNGALNVEWVQ
jgi:hypothetical protein